MNFNFYKRKAINWASMALAMFTTFIGLFFLCWILWTLLSRGLSGMNIALFTQMTPPPGADGGGLLNAIGGSLIMVILGTLIATPIGVMVGIYMVEINRYSKLTSTVRFINDILLSAPSIVIGLFVYMLVVVQVKHFSGWAGTIALAIIALPIIVRTTENMLVLVPHALREAAFALGASRRKTILSVSLIAARNGVLTGILLSVARISGETAPLMFTALNNQFWQWDLNQPLANLPVVIFQFAMSPYDNWQRIAWAGASVITLAILGLNIVTRIYFRQGSTR